MPGGLLNLVSEGNLNVFLTGNPTKTFFKCVYKKYSNFGLQRLRIDYSGQRFLNIDQDSVFTFKVPRYAELLMDTFLVINIPDIWSPVYGINWNVNTGEHYGIPYEFQWINNLGIEMIREITISSGGQILQKMSGSYLNALKERDYDINRKSLHDRMTGNTKDMYDPANAQGHLGRYPNAVNWHKENDPTNGPIAEPSIRGRKLYIPIDAWFSLTSKMAFPLVSMQYNELQIKIQLRPVREMFTIRNVLDQENNYPRIQPNFNNAEHGFYRFIQSPPNQVLQGGTIQATSDYQDKNVEWNTDIHLMATYAFLTDDESKQFASHEQQYLFKEIHEYKFDNITGAKKLRVESMGMVASWMFYFQRNDIFERNQWGNFTNWDYNTKPYQITKYHPDHNFYDAADSYGLFSYPTKYYNRLAGIDENTFVRNLYVDYNDGNYDSNFGKNLKIDNACNCDMFEERLYNTGPLKIENHKDILIDMAIMFDGQYREENLDAGIFNYVEKYSRTTGNAKDGLYCYNFCLSTNPFDTQPSGAINMSKFEKIELEINTVEPPQNPNAEFTEICDDDGDVIGVRQPSWDIFKYNFNLTIFEERYNILHFMGGNCALKFSR